MPFQGRVCAIALLSENSGNDEDHGVCRCQYVNRRRPRSGGFQPPTVGGSSNILLWRLETDTPWAAPFIAPVSF